MSTTLKRLVISLLGLTVVIILILFPLNQWLSGRVITRPPVGTTIVVQASAYSSSPSQTDSTPCVTAAGTIVRDGVIATNFLPFGTVVKIGEKQYVVEDRMNKRYNGRFIDIWFPRRADALDFGRRTVTLTVVQYSSLKDRARLAIGALTHQLKAALPDAFYQDVDCSQAELPI